MTDRGDRACHSSHKQSTAIQFNNHPYATVLLGKSTLTFNLKNLYVEEPLQLIKLNKRARDYFWRLCSQKMRKYAKLCKLVIAKKREETELQGMTFLRKKAIIIYS